MSEKINELRKTVMFLGEECLLQFGKYGNGRTAIELIVKETGEPMATATVNLIRAELNDDEVIIKDYSENEGMHQALLEAGIVGPVLRKESSSFVTCPVCKLLVDLNDYLDDYLDGHELEVGKVYWVENGHWDFKVKAKNKDHLEIYIIGLKKNSTMPFKDFKDYYQIKRR